MMADTVFSPTPEDTELMLELLCCLWSTWGLGELVERWLSMNSFRFACIVSTEMVVGRKHALYEQLHICLSPLK